MTFTYSCSVTFLSDRRLVRNDWPTLSHVKFVSSSKHCLLTIPKRGKRFAAPGEVKPTPRPKRGGCPDPPPVAPVPILAQR